MEKRIKRKTIFNYFDSATERFISIYKIYCNFVNYKDTAIKFRANMYKGIGNLFINPKAVLLKLSAFTISEIFTTP